GGGAGRGRGAGGGGRAAERGEARENRAPPAVAHHYAAMRAADLDAVGQPGQDRPPRAQPLRFEPAALRLLVVLARQLQPFQRRSRTSLYENAAGRSEATVMKRQNARPLAPPPSAH